MSYFLSRTVIEPVGIETDLNSGKWFLRTRTVIEPVGIETNLFDLALGWKKSL